MSLNINEKLLTYSIKIIAALFFIIISIYNVSNIKLDSDTLNYYYDYMGIYNHIFPYGVEIVIPFIMSICNNLGFDFYSFLFVLLIFWIPILFFFCDFVYKKPLYFLIVLFLIFGSFQPNAIFLIRSFMALIFVFYFFISKNKFIKLIMFTLAILTQITSILFLLSASILFYKKIITRKILAVIMLLITLFLSNGVLAKVLSIIDFSYFKHILPYVIYRKLEYYNGDILFLNVSWKMLLVFFVIGLCSVFYKSKTQIEMKINSMIYIQALLVIFFSDNIITANRVGLIIFYFYIPILIIYVQYFLVRIYYGNKDNRSFIKK